MNHRSLTLRLAAAAALATLATGAFAQDAPRLAVKTDGLPTFVARAIEEKAGQGVGALRQYVERTRMIHGLYIPDLVRAEEAAVEQAAVSPAEEAPVVAQRQAPVVAQRQASSSKVAASRSSKPQLAKNAKAAPVQVAKAKPSAPAKTVTASASVPQKLALAGQKTKRA